MIPVKVLAVRYLANRRPDWQGVWARRRGIPVWGC